MAEGDAREGGTATAPRSERLETMRAAVIEAPRRAAIASRSVPVPGPGEVRIRLEGCGVCGSNLPVWQGREWFEYPRDPGSPGHEGWGVVDAVGEDVTGVSTGDRVAALSYHAFAGWDVAAANAVARLPEGTEGKPFPGEALGCAMNVFRRCDVREGQTVAVIGVGFLGALLVQLCAKAGATVIAVSRRGTSLEIARRMGAAETVASGERGETVGAVKEIAGEAECERVIEATGYQEPLDLAGDLVGVRGRLIVAGYHQDGLRRVNMQQWNWRGIDVINAHERDERVYVRGMREAAEAVASGRLDPEPLYTHEFPLEKIGEAFRLLDERPEGFVKALVRT